MPRLIQARIVTPTGARIEGVIANLTATGVFVRTPEDLRVGQAVTVKLLAQTMPGQVLFVSRDPVGVVLSLRPNAEARAVILTAAPDVEVLLPPEPVPPDEMWGESTNANTIPPVEDAEGAPSRLGAGDLEVLEPSTNLDLTPIDMIHGFDDTVPPSDELPRIDDLSLGDDTDRSNDSLPRFDPSLFAAASIDDGLVAPSEPVAPVDLANDVPILEPELAHLPSADATDAVAAMEPPSHEPDTAATARRALEAPLDQPTDPESDVSPVLELLASEPEENAAPSPDESLPTLDKDGYTVRFASPDAYSVQFAANIEHGGLVVLADALPIGTQRMLALDIPGSAAYTVSARVIYHQEGKLGFMLDSLHIHKARLKQLAQAS